MDCFELITAKYFLIEKRSTFELVISEEAHQHLRQVWSTIDEDWFKEQVNMEFFQMDFRNGS
jgi:hypothetical protein